jgi:flagellar motor switch protein FliM
MIDRVLGGPGRASIQVRELTEIERALVSRILRKILVELQQAWAKVGRFDVRLVNLETNPQFVQLTSPNDIAVLVTFDVRVGEVGGIMNLCLPFAMLEPVLPKLMTQRWAGGTPVADSSAVTREVEGRLRSTSLEIRAVLEPLRLPISELTRLKPGDILPLPWREDLNVTVEVGGVPCFGGRAGRKHRWRAVEITASLEGGGRHG